MQEGGGDRKLRCGSRDENNLSFVVFVVLVIPPTYLIYWVWEEDAKM